MHLWLAKISHSMTEKHQSKARFDLRNTAVVNTIPATHTHMHKPYQTDQFFLPSLTWVMFPLLHLEPLPLHKMKSFRVCAMRGMLLQPNIENVNFLASTDHL